MHKLCYVLTANYTLCFTLIFISALEGGEGLASRSGHTLPPGKTPYPLYKRLGGPQGRKISPPPGFDPRTVQLVGSRYTDYATRQPPTLLISSKDVTKLFGIFIEQLSVAISSDLPVVITVGVVGGTRRRIRRRRRKEVVLAVVVVVVVSLLKKHD